MLKKVSSFRGVLVCALLISFIGVAAIRLHAQAVSQISGTVKDDSGAVVPNAQVTATQTETGVKRTATADASGNYLLPNLPLGPYRLEVSAQGFSTYVQAGITLQVGSSPTVPVILKVGQVSESVSVEANVSAVETRSAQVGTVVEAQRVLELPLNGRQPTDLITLSGAAVQTGTSPGYDMRTGVNISVAGGTSYSIQYNLDGASHLDTYGGTSMPLPFPDALQEFKLVTSTQEASGGGHSGAAVNSVTKSGTNSLHGDIFEFFRNAALNGRDFFALANDKLKRNQFGGVIGGPLKKDKLFFFAGYQGTFIRQTPSDTTEFVPTAAMLNGDFSAYIANNCPGAAAMQSRGTVVNGRLVPALSPAAVAISKRLPSSSDPCGKVATGAPLSENDLQVPVRIDFQKSERHSIFARYLATRIDTKLPYSIKPTDVLTTGFSSGVGMDDMAQSLAFGDTLVLSPTLVNAFHVYGNRVGANTPGASFFGPQDVGIKNLFSYTPNYMILTGAGFNVGFNAAFSMSDAAVTNFGISDDVNLIHGSHQINFGANLMRAILIENSHAWDPGAFIFASAFTGAAMTDFMTGRAVLFHQANPNPNYTTQNFIGLYAGDTWKASSRLTLNYGLRWNPFFPMSFIQGEVSNFSLSAFKAGTRSTVIPTAPPGFTYPGDPGFDGKSGINTHWRNLEPRFGLAFDPFGDGKTSIRAGAGIAYDFIRQDFNQNASSVAPWRLTIIKSGPVSLDNPYPEGNPFPYSFNPAKPVFPSNVPYQSFFPIPPDLKTTEQYSWNFGMQRQLTPALFASATYLGTHLIHTWQAIDLNPGLFVPGTCPAGVYGLTAPGPCSTSGNVNQRRLLEQTNPSAGNVLGPMTSLDDGGTQSYNGLLLNLTYRKGNTSITGNYTWSHCIGLPIQVLANSNATYPHQPYQNNGPVNRKLDMGDCNGGTVLDIRHLVNITGVVKTPEFSGDWSRRLGSGWTFSTIVTARTGYPVTPLLGSDQALNGFNASGSYAIPQRPNQVLPDVNATNKGQSCSPAPCVAWWNPAAIALPAAGTYGNMGVGSLRAPGFWEWDQSISRQFKIREGQSFEIRAEAFNVTNSLRLYVAPTNSAFASFASGQFGKITSSASTTGSASATGNGGRIIQFALKYVF